MISNLLKTAFKIIPQSPFQYRIATGRTINDFGESVPTYGPWTDTRGSVQPGIVSSFGGKNISEREYKDLGLDPSRSTITIWIADTILSSTLDRKVADQVKYEGNVYNVIQTGSWNEYNGWRRLYCQREATI